MTTQDNFDKFAKLLDKHLYFLPLGFVEGEGYDNKFTRCSQIFVIIRMFLVDFHNKKIFNNDDTLTKLKKYNSIFLRDNKNKFESLNEELEVIEFLLSLEPLGDLKRN